MRALLGNRSLRRDVPILVVCYTNHALVRKCACMRICVRVRDICASVRYVCLGQVQIYGISFYRLVVLLVVQCHYLCVSLNVQIVSMSVVSLCGTCVCLLLPEFYVLLIFSRVGSVFGRSSAD